MTFSVENIDAEFQRYNTGKISDAAIKALATAWTYAKAAVGEVEPPRDFYVTVVADGDEYTIGVPQSHVLPFVAALLEDSTVRTVTVEED